MRRRKRNLFFNSVLLGTSALLLYSLRHRFGSIGDLKGSVAEGYQTASRPVRKASVFFAARIDTRDTATAILVGVSV
jgi:hypothetical protein